MGILFYSVIRSDHQLHRLQFPSLMRAFNLSIILPIFLACLILSWQASSTSPPSPPPTTISSVSDTLRDNGYSLFASTIESAISDITNQWNGTGTIFAPPDFAFSSFSNPKFKYGRSSSPRPSLSLLNFHTLRQPLKWHHLSVKSEDAFLTFSHRRCIFKCKNLAGELCIAGKKRHFGDYVRIRYPDLFVGENLVVHGVDGVLDPSDASKCSDNFDSVDPMSVFPSSPSQKGHLSTISHLDHAVRTLRRRGYSVVATAMATKRSDLMNLTGVTVFAPRDDNLFNLPDGWRYDFRYHVVPRQIRMTDLVRLQQGKEIDTLVPGKTIVVKSDNGVLTANGVPIDELEIYHNGWVAIISVPRPLQTSRSSDVPVGSPSVINDTGLNSDDSSDSVTGGRYLSPSTSVYSVNNPAPSPDSESDDVTREAPTTFSEYDEEDLTRTSALPPPPSPIVSIPVEIRCSPAALPVSDGGGGISALSVGLQSYCPMTPEGSPSGDVALSNK